MSRSALLATLTTLGAATVGFADVLGSNVFTISSGTGMRFPDVAYNSVNGEHLVVWADYNSGSLGVFGRRVSQNGSVNGSAFRISDVVQSDALYPAVAYNADNNEYLVTFDTASTVHGQRINAATGSLLSGNFSIGTTQGIRSGVAWNSTDSNYFVTYYAPGGSTDVYGRRVSNGGGVIGAEINVSSDANFSGYPTVAYSSAANEFLVTWDHEPSPNFGNIRGQRINASTGAKIGGGFNIATVGTESRSSIAYDSLNNRWLIQYNTIASGFSFDQYARFVNADGSLNPTGPILIAHSSAFEGETLLGTDIAYVPGHDGRFFSAFQLETTMFAGMGGQETFASGQPVASQINLGSGPYGVMSLSGDTNLNRFLTVFEGLNGSSHTIYGRLFQSEPVPADQIAQFTLNSDAQNWTLQTWRSGTNSFGTAQWDNASGSPAAGSIKSTGSGATNNQDHNTREGSYLTRPVSLAGYGNIMLRYDVKATLDAPPDSSATGSGNLLEGSPEDKLVIYYSTQGDDGPWTLAEVLTGSSLPGDWTRRTLNLSGIDSLINEDDFALRFAWQFNTAVDTGWIDNVLLSGTLLSPGDTDLDGDVDLSDLGNLASSYGAIGLATWPQGDFDNDGDVDLNDLSSLASNYGNGEAQAFADFQSLTVPEPTLGKMVTIGLFVRVASFRRLIEGRNR